MGQQPCPSYNGAMADVPNLKVGSKVDIEITKDALIIKPLAKKKLMLPFSESQLISNLTPALAHADELATLTGVELGD